MVTNQTTDLDNIDFSSGEIILVDKPTGWSSFKVVNTIRQSTGVKKVGHTGTLDPMATGLLIICTGKKTKQISNFLNSDKTYTGTITLGKTSPSMDKETKTENHILNDSINKLKIENEADKFIGEVNQTPPMYSAIKINGKRLYSLARKGIEVERPARKVKINSFRILNVKLPEIEFEVECSKGTYIRVLAHDLGQNLGCGAILTELRRTKIGDYNVNNAINVDEFVKKLNKKNESIISSGS